jgi:hypothetical protein
MCLLQFLLPFVIVGIVLTVIVLVLKWLRNSDSSVTAKPVKEEFKKTKKVTYTKKQVDVGMTFIDLDFSNGRQFQTCVIGQVYQGVRGDYYYNKYANTWYEPFVYPVSIHNSIAIAEQFLGNIDGTQVRTFCDDPAHPSVSATGIVIKATIANTVEWEIDINEAKLEDL